VAGSDAKAAGDVGVGLPQEKILNFFKITCPEFYL